MVFPSAFSDHSTLGAVSIAAILTIALFFRSQRRHPHELPTISTYFPWLGMDNIISFYRKPSRFIESARLKYGPFYKFKAGGANIAILLQPFSLRQLERVTTDLTDHLPIEMTSKAASGYKDIQPVLDILVQHLTPTITRELSPSAIIKGGLRVMFNDALSRELDAIVLPAKGPVLLKTLVCKSMYNATSLIFFGPTFPFSTYNDFLIMNANIPLLTSDMSRLPFFKATRARKRWHAQIIKYMEAWWESNGAVSIAGVSQLTLDFLNSVKDAGFSIEEAACGMVGYAWGVHNNLWFHLYWCMAHTLVDEQVRNEVEHEARLATSDKSLAEAAEIPMIDSVYHEAMQWPFSVGQVRKSKSDLNLVLGGENYFVEKGTWILARNINHSPLAYSEPLEFQHRRFMDSSVPKHGTYGNGRGICKGRHFSSMQFPDFVVQCFKKYDIKAFTKDKQPARIPRVVGSPFLPDVATLEDFLIEIKPTGLEGTQ